MPCIIVLHLKRFEFQNTTNKINSPVQISTSLLLESQKESDKQNEPYQYQNYNIMGIVNHLGNSINSGHYTTDILNEKSKNWQNYDDNNVKKMSQDEVLKNRKNTLYILFFIQN